MPTGADARRCIVWYAGQGRVVNVLRPHVTVGQEPEDGRGEGKVGVREAAVPFEVLWGDADPSGLIYYQNVFRYVAQAESALFRQIGYTVRTMIAEGFANPRAHVEADFRKPLWVHDTGTCRVWVGRIGNSSVRLDFALTKDGDSEPAVTGHLVMVFVDPEAMRPIPVPEVLRRAFGAGEESGDD